LRTGGTLPAVLNAANEISVQAFLDGKIRLSEIAQINEKVMNLHETEAANSLEIILEADGWARKEAENLIKSNYFVVR
jgi:1-deoxy-D-xylulose-5-phosphate reductoisomerase